MSDDGWIEPSGGRPWRPPREVEPVNDCIYAYQGYDQDHLFIPMCLQSHHLCVLADEDWYRGHESHGCVIDFGPWGAWRSFVGQLREYDGSVEERKGHWYVYWPRRLWEPDEVEFLLGHEPGYRFMGDWSAWGRPSCHYRAMGLDV